MHDLKYPLIVVLEEKHDSRYFLATTSYELGKISLKIFLERLNKGIYPSEAEKVKPFEVFEYLKSRTGECYEHFHIIYPEKI